MIALVTVDPNLGNSAATFAWLAVVAIIAKLHAHYAATGLP